MKNSSFWIFLLVNTLIIIACGKEGYTEPSCATELPTKRILTEQNATVREIGGEYYIFEPNTIDSKLRPCNLDPSFAIDNISVVVSGHVKKTPLSSGEPCCTDLFIITGITR